MKVIKKVLQWLDYQWARDPATMTICIWITIGIVGFMILNFIK